MCREPLWVAQTSQAPGGAADSALPVHLTLPHPEGDSQLSGHSLLESVIWGPGAEMAGLCPRSLCQSGPELL